MFQPAQGFIKRPSIHETYL